MSCGEGKEKVASTPAFTTCVFHTCGHIKFAYIICTALRAWLFVIARLPLKKRLSQPVAAR